MSILLKRKYESIDQSKISDAAKNALSKIKEATNNFSSPSATKQLRGKFLELYDKIKSNKPEAIKGFKAPKATRTRVKAASVAKTASSAVGIAKRLLEKAKERRKAQGLGTSDDNIIRDAGRPALPTGKRISKKSKKTYYEYRENRIDRKPKNYPKLSEGGGIEDVSKSLYVAELYDSDGNLLGYTVRDKHNASGKYTLSSKKETAEENRQYLIDNPSRLAYYRKNEYAKGGMMRNGMEMHRADMNGYAKGGYAIKAYANQDYDNQLGLFYNLDDAKKYAKANKWKYETITFEDKQGDSIVVSKNDTFKDVDWLFSNTYAKGGNISNRSNYLSQREIDHIETKKGKVIKGSQVIDGAYVKKGVKFADGGMAMPEVSGFKLIYENWDLPMDGIAGTIRTYPQNYWVASVNTDGEVVFNSWESMVKAMDMGKVKMLWDSGQIRSKNEPKVSRYMFEEEEFEYANGGGVGLKVGDEVTFQQKYFSSYLTHKGKIQSISNGVASVKYVNPDSPELKLVTDIPITNLQKYAKGGGVGEISSKSVGIAKRIKIKNWYIETYPTDELGEQINDEINFWWLWTYMSQGYSPYDVLGVYDSVVRERVFEKLAEILNVDYDVVYNKWLETDKYAKGGSLLGGSHYNTGRSWHLDRARHNQNEDWEKPMNQRKKRS